MTALAEPGRRERKRVQTLDHLAATAFALFEAHGYDTVTMEQIAAAADVAKGTLYNHFPVKEALLAHQFRKEFAQGVAGLRGRIEAETTFAGRMGTFLAASAQWCRQRRPYLMPYFRYRFSGEGERSGSDEAFGAIIAAAQQTGELRDDMPTVQLALLFKQFYLGALLRWLTLPGLDLDSEMAAIIDLFQNGARRRS